MGNNIAKLDKKAIRVSIRNQIEIETPHFSKLKRKVKREIVREIAHTVIQQLENEELQIPVLSESERLGLCEIPAGILSMDAMKDFIEDHQRTVLNFSNPAKFKKFKNPLVKKMNEILDDSLLNRLLATRKMTPAMRDWMPAQLLRIELLRTALFPEWSIRKFCGYMENLNQKEERSFCKLPLHKYKMCDHSTLSTFRSSLTFEMRVNLMVFMAYHFMEAGHVGKNNFHLIDSTDVAEPINNAPLAKIKMPDGSDLRFYSDLDSDCGSRRNKRDKSKYIVGYRVHTICVADTDNQIAFPLLSVAVAANHHDSQTLDLMLTLAEAMGLNIKVLSADEAYADADKQKRLLKENMTMVVTAPKEKAEIPENIDSENGDVFMDSFCETPMRWDGFDKKSDGHCFVCNNDNECFRKALCQQERIIPIDTGLFGPIPKSVDYADQVTNIRKITERPFNLMKHMDGLEPGRMKTQATFSSQMVFSQTIGLFKVMAGLRAIPKEKEKMIQEVLPLAVNG